MTHRMTSHPIDLPHAAGIGRSSVAGFASPWLVEVSPSSRLTLAIVAGHALGAGAVMAAQGPAPVTLVLLSAILASTVFQLARLARLWLPHSFVRLELAWNGRLQLGQRDGSERSGWLLPSTVVDSRLTVVRFRLDGQRFPRSVLLLADNCAPEAFRRLRVGLSWHAGRDAGRYAGRALGQRGMQRQQPVD